MEEDDISLCEALLANLEKQYDLSKRSPMIHRQIVELKTRCYMARRDLKRKEKREKEEEE